MLEDGVDQLPNKDFTAGGSALGAEPVGAVTVGGGVKLGKADRVTVVLLIDAPNTDDVLTDITGAEVAVVREGAGRKTAADGVPPNTGLKLCTDALLSALETATEDVVLTEKIGLNPDTSRGAVLAAGAAGTCWEAEQTGAGLLAANAPSVAADDVPLEGLDT